MPRAALRFTRRSALVVTDRVARAFRQCFPLYGGRNHSMTELVSTEFKRWPLSSSTICPRTEWEFFQPRMHMTWRHSSISSLALLLIRLMLITECVDHYTLQCVIVYT